MRWRKQIALAAGLPPLDLMEGFYQSGSPIHDPFWRSGLDSELSKPSVEGLPIQWECLKPSALHILLHHSDCDGEIEAKDCASIADALETLLPNLPTGDGGGHIGDWTEKTQQFIAGLRAAAENQESVKFH